MNDTPVEKYCEKCMAHNISLDHECPPLMRFLKEEYDKKNKYSYCDQPNCPGHSCPITPVEKCKCGKDRCCQGDISQCNNCGLPISQSVVEPPKGDVNIGWEVGVHDRLDSSIEHNWTGGFERRFFMQHIRKLLLSARVATIDECEREIKIAHSYKCASRVHTKDRHCDCYALEVRTAVQDAFTRMRGNK